ncbi:MAG TPA: CvpA family protein, partial [Dongiaceae bacterium]|nr:CvpA family protein [Dongiaceae bacterium]
MTIWILALLLMASAVSLGHRQGAIRAGFSFLGIVFASLLAAPIGGLFKPLLAHMGIHNQTLAWMVAPIEGFAIVLIIFKIAGFIVHRKINVHYKYNAGDLQGLLWTRLNARLGACIGVLNGAAYLVLACFFI